MGCTTLTVLDPVIEPVITDYEILACGIDSCPVREGCELRLGEFDHAAGRIWVRNDNDEDRRCSVWMRIRRPDTESVLLTTTWFLVSAGSNVPILTGEPGDCPLDLVGSYSIIPDSVGATWAD